MIHNPENLIPLMLFFIAIYWFFRWVVYDMNRPTDDGRRTLIQASKQPLLAQAANPFYIRQD